MKNFLFVVFLSIVFIILPSKTFDVQNYIHQVESFSRNETFRSDYRQWSLKLFSQSDYLYGPTEKTFPCRIDREKVSQRANANSVHQLRPENIQCIAAMGDSLITGLASHALTIYGVLFENQGMSWAMGGDYSYSLVVSIPNILREFNPKLKGFLSTDDVLSIGSANASFHGLNIAFTDTRTSFLPVHTELLLFRFQSNTSCNWNDDWKMINILVGHSDLCHFCDDLDKNLSTPKHYVESIRNSLDRLYNSSLPKTLINLIPIFDIRQIKVLARENRVCQLFQNEICPCADQTEILDDFISKYRQSLFDLIKSNRYDGREDFTVVLQPFLIKTKIETNDRSFFAPDCFHWSGKGHWQMALSLWNNMFEPVGHKRMSWSRDETLKCPTEEFPFIFTSKNSRGVANQWKSSTVATTNETIEENNSTSTIENHKEKKLSEKRSNVYLLFAIGLIVVGLVILFTTRRKTVRVVMSSTKQRHFKRFTDGPEDDDEENDEVDVWSHPRLKSREEIPKTLGSRIDFD